MELMLRGVYLHPSGQMPAYEWNFSDVNPPVHAFATLFLHHTEKALHGQADVDFLKSAFKAAPQLHLVVNRKDRLGKNVFEGGFLGLDNIGIFNRSAPLPTGGHLEQADGTAWMALFSQNMLEMASELGRHDPHLRGHGLQVRRAFPLHRRRHEPARPGPACGRGGRVLLRPAASTRRKRDAPQGAVDGRLLPPAPSRSSRRRRGIGCRGSWPVSPSGAAGCPNCSTPCTPRAGALQRGRAQSWRRQPGAAPPILTKMLDENEFWALRHPVVVQVHEKSPYVFDVQGEDTGQLPARRVEHREYSEETPTGEAPCGCP